MCQTLYFGPHLPLLCIGGIEEPDVSTNSQSGGSQAGERNEHSYQKADSLPNQVKQLYLCSKPGYTLYTTSVQVCMVTQH